MPMMKSNTLKQPIEHLSPSRSPRGRKVFLLHFGLVNVRLEVHLFRLDEFGLLEELPYQKHDEHDG